MIDTITIDIQRTERSRREETNFDDLIFGRTFSDHMFVMDYKDNKWGQPRIMPFQNMSLSPAASVVHYGQSIFEGLKAFKNKEGRFGLFRPDRNIQRMNKSAVRMCMPEIPTEVFMDAITTLVQMDREWIPTGELSSLYLRPVLFALDEYIGVKASQTYRFMIFSSPVNAYYSKPVNVKIERHFTRAARGGTGFAKAAGNYAGSLYPAKLANEQGYDQLLWTDAKEHKFIEESGTMNVMFLIDNVLITPELSDSILEGVTRSSVLDLARSWGYKVEERKIAVEELIKALKDNTLQEAFGCGTAATIAHISGIGDDDNAFVLPNISTRKLSNRLSKYFTDLKKFRIADEHNWMISLS